MEQNELVKQATVTVTDVAKKGVQYVENAPLIKDFNEEQKKFIRLESFFSPATIDGLFLAKIKPHRRIKRPGRGIKMRRSSRIRFCNSQRYDFSFIGEK